MPATPDDLFAFLDRLGIARATVHHAQVTGHEPCIAAVSNPLAETSASVDPASP